MILSQIFRESFIQKITLYIDFAMIYLQYTILVMLFDFRNFDDCSGCLKLVEPEKPESVGGINGHL